MSGSYNGVCMKWYEILIWVVWKWMEILKVDKTPKQSRFKTFLTFKVLKMAESTFESTWVCSLVVDSSFPIFFLVRFHFWNITKKTQRLNSSDEQQILDLMLEMIRLIYVSAHIYLNILPCSSPAGQASDVLLRKRCVSERCPPSCPAVCWTCCWQAALCVLYDGWDCFKAICWIFSKKKAHHLPRRLLIFEIKRTWAD